jgi:hypothetical protein
VTAITPYDSGYNHGCDDAKVGGHPYLDIPGTGQEFHTPEFMQQYNDGYNDCSPPSSNHQFINSCGGGSTQDYCRGYHDGAVQVDREDEARGADLLSVLDFMAVHMIVLLNTVKDTKEDIMMKLGSSCSSYRVQLAYATPTDNISRL